MIVTPLGFAAPTFADLGYPFVPVWQKGVKRAAIKLWLNIAGPHCPNCGVLMRVRSLSEDRPHPRNATIDHYLAKSLGGDIDDGRNLWVICHECNWNKGQIERELSEARR